LGRELEVEFARGDRKSKSIIIIIFCFYFENHFRLLAPSEMRAREKEARHGGRGGGDFNRRDRSRR